MFTSIDKYEWHLEGDLSATVFLQLSFIATVDGLGLREVKLAEVNPIGATFAIGGEDIVCDGLPRDYGQKPNPTLPVELELWFARRFRSEWNNNAHLQTEIVDLLEQQAISQHWERVAERV